MSVWELWALLQHEVASHSRYTHICNIKDLKKCIRAGLKKHPNDVSYVVDRCIEKHCIEYDDEN